MNINWYPGHMAKALRILKESIKYVDTVVNILDARVPKSSFNPVLKDIAGKRPIIILLNKYDLADEKQNETWAQYYRESEYYCTCINANTGEGIAKSRELIFSSTEEKLQKEREKGRRARAVRVMVTGMPNVGKSSYINRISGKAAAPVGDMPGVTRGVKWIRIGKGVELMDTPGILVPKIEDKLTGLKLAWTGAIKDEILDVEELAAGLLDFLWNGYKENIIERYKINDLPEIQKTSGGTGYMLLECCAKARGCILSGGRIDTLRFSGIFLDEFRSGKLGRFTLDAGA